MDGYTMQLNSLAGLQVCANLSKGRQTATLYTSEQDAMAIENLMKLYKKDLEAACTERNIPSKGNKRQLAGRLLHHGGGEADDDLLQADAVCFYVREENLEEASALWVWILSLDGGTLVPDAGFPRFASLLPANMIVRKPPTARKDEPLAASAVLELREITKWRGVIERAHRRMKRWRMLSQRTSNKGIANQEIWWKLQVSFAIGSLCPSPTGTALEHVNFGSRLLLYSF
eukprot:TRINITY_DN6673_c0_g1_i1.p1 TRINITY_DN6673_c0_g1~~TRINITY_DN6673_c0_g1_i1.p1  ORF type:complete len:230 (+),score=43.55 TRINITY_DN6673_c0_g1_i1:632-1321(+)